MGARLWENVLEFYNALGEMEETSGRMCSGARPGRRGLGVLLNP